MEDRQSGFSFFLMSLQFKIRDIIKPRKNVLKEVGIKTGFYVLDFGCGPGGYIKSLAKMVGPSGKIYALDVNPTALESVKRIALKNKITNIETILSDGATGLPDAGLDAVLLYDVLHHLVQRDTILAELRRVLKNGGVLSVTDHHLTEEDILSRITASGFFRLREKGKIVYNFTGTDRG